MLNDATQSVPAKRAVRRKPRADEPRRTYSLEFKLKVLEEAMAPGASVAAVALRHNMNTNVVFRWRKLLREGRLTGTQARSPRLLPAPAFAPVRIAPDEAALPVPQVIEAPKARSGGKQQAVRCKKAGTVSITLPGGFTLRADADIDEAALRRLLRAVSDLA